MSLELWQLPNTELEFCALQNLTSYYLGSGIAPHSLLSHIVLCLAFGIQAVRYVEALTQVPRILRKSTRFYPTGCHRVDKCIHHVDLVTTLFSMDTVAQICKAYA